MHSVKVEDTAHDRRWRLTSVETRVLITGAASGIGEAIAMAFAEERARVALLDVDTEGMRRVGRAVEGIGGRPLILEADVSDEAQVMRAFDQVLSTWHGLDVLVGNAAVQLHGQDGAVDMLDKSVWDRTIAVNLTGMYLTCKYGIRALRAAGGGAVVMTGSPTGIRGSARGYDAYSASKAGVIGLMRVLANEYGREGIRVNAVVPGYTDTPLVRGQVPTGRHEQIIAGIPLGRQGTARDVARVVRFLCSDDASYVHGSIYMVDGGTSAI